MNEYNFIDELQMTKALEELFAEDAKETSHICDVAESLLYGYNMQVSVSNECSRETLLLAYVSKVVSKLAKEVGLYKDAVEIAEYERDHAKKELSNALPLEVTE